MLLCASAPRTLDESFFESIFPRFRPVSQGQGSVGQGQHQLCSGGGHRRPGRVEGGHDGRSRCSQR